MAIAEPTIDSQTRNAATAAGEQAAAAANQAKKNDYTFKSTTVYQWLQCFTRMQNC